MACILKNCRKSAVRVLLCTILLSFIVTFFSSSWHSANREISGLSGNIVVTAILKSELSDDSISITKKIIKSYDWCRKIEYISSDSARAIFGSRVGKVSKELLPENPLPAVINVFIKAHYLNSFNLTKINLVLQKLDAVERTIFRRDYADYVFLIRSQFEFITIFTGIFLLLVLFFISFFSINPEFTVQKSRVLSLDFTGDGSKTGTAYIFGFINIVGLIGIVLGGLLEFLIWVLVNENLPWFRNTPWQILLLSLGFMLVIYNLMIFVLHLIHKSKKKPQIVDCNVQEASVSE
jgi:cell division protein FtsX